MSPKGDVLWRHTSHARSYVSFTPDHVRSMRGNALTHNHPSGRSLSVEDISLAMRVGLSEIRAVGSTGYTYSMRPKKGRPWSESFLVNTLGPALQRIGPVVQRELERMILARQITPDEANFRLWHDIWTRVSREIGVHYTRRRHG